MNAKTPLRGSLLQAILHNGALVLDTVRFVLAAKLPVEPIVRVG